MKYDFDTLVDRKNAPYQYSSKWADLPSNRTRYNFGRPLPEDRIPMQTADMDFKCPPEMVDALVKTAEHGIYGYTEIPDDYYDAVISWFARQFDWRFAEDYGTMKNLLGRLGGLYWHDHYVPAHA